MLKITFLLIIIVISILLYYFIWNDNSLNNDFEELNFLWSKGLVRKDKYALRDTETKGNSQEIKEKIMSDDEYLWIRVNDLDLLNENLQYLEKDKIIISGDGDLTIPDDIDKTVFNNIIAHPHIKLWLAQNLNDHSVNKLKNYPIGFDLHTKRVKEKINNRDLLNQLNIIRDKKVEKKFKIFSDVHLRTHKYRFNNERQRVKDILYNCKHTSFQKYKTNIYNIWNNYHSHQFVISAFGNGLDCHRTWEIIYLGSIVIVKTSKLDPLYEGLPVVIVKDWDECLDINNLHKWYNEHKHKTNKAYLEKYFKYDYWLEKYQ